MPDLNCNNKLRLFEFGGDLLLTNCNAMIRKLQNTMYISFYFEMQAET